MKEAIVNDSTFLGVLVTVAGAFIVLIYRGGALIGAMQSTMTELRAAIADLKSGLEALKELPLLRQRIATLEDIVRTNTARTETLWAKVFSLDKHQAVSEARRSRPDTESD